MDNQREIRKYPEPDEVLPEKPKDVPPPSAPTRASEEDEACPDSYLLH